MSSKKKNPTIQMRASEIKKLKADCSKNALEASMAIFLTVMHDKEGYGITRLRRLHNRLNEYAEMVSEGYVSIKELKEALADEMGIRITFGDELQKGANK